MEERFRKALRTRRNENNVAVERLFFGVSVDGLLPGRHTLVICGCVVAAGDLLKDR